MRLLALIGKDIRIFLKHPGSLILTFLVPMVITLIFGMVFGGFGKSSGINGILVVGVDEDQSEYSKKLMKAIGDLEEIRLVTEYTQGDSTYLYTGDVMDEHIKKGKRHIGIRIAKGFQDSLKAGDQPNIHVNYDPKYPIEQGIVNGLMQRTIMMQMPDLMQERLFKQADDYLGDEKGQGFRDDLLKTLRTYFDPNIETLDIPTTNAFTATESDTTATDENNFSMADIAPIKLRSTQLLGVDEDNPMFAHSVAGMAVMFLLFSVSGAASSLLHEKQDGTIKRLMISPALSSEILWGKALFIILVGVVQLIVMFIFGWLVFGLNIFKDVPALLIMIVSTAISCATLGMLIAAACRDQKQVDEISTLLILGMSALGGSMFPSFIMPSYLQFIGKFTLNHWAMNGITNIFWRNLHVVDILPHAGVLLGAAIVFFLIAWWLFKKRLFND